MLLNVHILMNVLVCNNSGLSGNIENAFSVKLWKVLYEKMRIEFNVIKINYNFIVVVLVLF